MTTIPATEVRTGDAIRVRATVGVGSHRRIVMTVDYVEGDLGGLVVLAGLRHRTDRPEDYAGRVARMVHQDATVELLSRPADEAHVDEPAERSTITTQAMHLQRGDRLTAAGGQTPVHVFDLEVGDDGRVTVWTSLADQEAGAPAKLTLTGVQRFQVDRAGRVAHCGYTGTTRAWRGALRRGSVTVASCCHLHRNRDHGDEPARRCLQLLARDLLSGNEDGVRRWVERTVASAAVARTLGAKVTDEQRRAEAEAIVAEVRRVTDTGPVTVYGMDVLAAY